MKLMEKCLLGILVLTAIPMAVLLWVGVFAILGELFGF